MGNEGDPIVGKLVLLFKDRIKTILIHIIRAFVRATFVLPMKENRIVFFSYYGKQYSCNPKVISDYVRKHYPGKYEVIWAFSHPEDFKRLESEGIRLVKYNSIKRIILESTAKYTINNCGAFSWMPRRKNQVHVNTWHAGGAYKRLTTGTSYNRKLTAKETSHMISGCALFTRHNIDECFGYQGTVLEIGMPRNDVFFHKDEMKNTGERVRKALGIGSDVFIVLYAPTWRYNGKIPHPDFDMIRQAVSARFGKEAVILGRSHSADVSRYREITDVSDYPDMQDLLCASDMLITDYSSSIWDYSFTYRPCMLYVEDLDRYESEQGFLTDIRKWGFPLCRNNEQLRRSILEFDEESNRRNMDMHHEMFGSFEHGNATERFCKAIFG